MIRMKKRLIALAVCITLLLSACGKEASTSVDNKPEKEATVSEVKSEKDDSADNSVSNDSKVENEAAGNESGDISAPSRKSESGEKDNVDADSGSSAYVQQVGSDAKSGTNWVYKLVAITNLDDGYSYDIEDVYSPYLYVTRYRSGKTIVSGIFWTYGDYIGTAEYDLGEGFMSGMVNFDAYDMEGNMGEFAEMYVSIEGNTATATDENLRTVFSFVLDETFDF